MCIYNYMMVPNFITVFAFPGVHIFFGSMVGLEAYMMVPQSKIRSEI